MEFSDKAKKRILGEFANQGFVFWLKSERAFESDRLHFFIVLNKEPARDGFLLLVNGSSRIRKRERFLMHEGTDIAATTVRLHPGDYPFVTKETIIDCNSVTVLEIDSLTFAQDEARFLSAQMKQKDVDRLVRAVKNSPSVAEVYKGLM